MLMVVPLQNQKHDKNADYVIMVTYVLPNGKFLGVKMYPNQNSEKILKMEGLIFRICPNRFHVKSVSMTKNYWYFFMGMSCLGYRVTVYRVLHYKPAKNNHLSHCV